jgi:hypothetical protein
MNRGGCGSIPSAAPSCFGARMLRGSARDDRDQVLRSKPMKRTGKRILTQHVMPPRIRLAAPGYIVARVGGGRDAQSFVHLATLPPRHLGALPNARKCYLCARNEVLPLSQEGQTAPGPREFRQFEHAKNADALILRQAVGTPSERFFRSISLAVWTLSRAVQSLHRVQRAGYPAPCYLCARDSFDTGQTAKCATASSTMRCVHQAAYQEASFAISQPPRVPCGSS